MIVKYDKVYGPYTRKDGQWYAVLHYQGKRNQVLYNRDKAVMEARVTSLRAQIGVQGFAETFTNEGEPDAGLDIDHASRIEKLANGILEDALTTKGKEQREDLKTRVVALKGAEDAIKAVVRIRAGKTLDEGTGEDIQALSYDDLVARAKKLIAEHEGTDNAAAGTTTAQAGADQPATERGGSAEAGAGGPVALRSASNGAKR